jgi:cilia- and flagella-associated protein 52
VHNNAIKIWTFDPNAKRLKFFDCPLGHIKRYILNVSIDPIDEHAYCGTRSGDVLEISLSKGIYNRSGPVDKKFKGSVNQVISKFKHLYLGTQDGTFAKIDKHTMLCAGTVTYGSCSVSALAASESKVYNITTRG